MTLCSSGIFFSVIRNIWGSPFFSDSYGTLTNLRKSFAEVGCASDACDFLMSTGLAAHFSSSFVCFVLVFILSLLFLFMLTM
jgi:hypothetical protein